MSKFARIFKSEYLMYLRKSRQDDPNETVEEVLRKHEIQLQEYALKQFGYRIPEGDIYREVVSGEMIDDRPEINRMFKRIESEDIKGVIVIEPQRLTRGDMLDCGIIEHMFRYTNTHVVTPSKRYDLSDKYDRKLFEMELSRGSDYLEYTKEILERGRKASVKRGNYIGSIPPYGYDRVKVGKEWTLIPNESEAQYVRMIFDLYNAGDGCSVIANKIESLGARPRKGDHFETIVITQILKNPVYTGKLKISQRETIKVIEDGKIKKKRIRNKEYETVDGKHEPLVSDDVFKKVQERFGRNSRENTRYELHNIYAGIMKCSICGKAIMLVPYKNRALRLKCRNQKHCHNMSHNLDEIHDAIISQLKTVLHDFEIKVELDNTDDINSRITLINSLKKQLDDNDKKMDSICDYLEKGIYTPEMFIARKKIIENERQTIKQAIKNAECDMNKTTDIQTKIVTLHKAIDMLNDNTISIKDKNEFLKSFIDVVYYKKEKVGNSDRITIDIHLR